MAKKLQLFMEQGMSHKSNQLGLTSGKGQFIADAHGNSTGKHLMSMTNNSSMRQILTSSQIAN